MPKKKKTRFAPDGTPLDKKTRKADDRDKAKKAKAAEDKAAGIKPAEPVRKVGKGHRQKGAGTIMTSREERELGGVAVKDWQRMPSQLLHEHCQRNKIPKPCWNAMGAPGKCRNKIVLPDAKKVKEKAMIFVTKESYATTSLAKEHSALMALKHLTPTAPHERKLPEPYRSVWLAMTTAAPSQNSGKPLTAKEKAAAKAEEKARKKAAAQERAKKPAKTAGVMPDQVSDSAPTPAPASDALAPTLVKAKAKAIEPVAKAEVKTSVPQLHERPELQSARDAVAALHIAAPTSQLGKFASQHDKRMARAEKDQARRTRERKRENFERSNSNANVLMSETKRTLVEAILRELGVGVKATGGGVRPAAEADVDAALLEPLLVAGFREEDARMSLMCVPTGGDAALDWLCLNVPEHHLPAAYDPRGKQLETLNFSGDVGEPEEVRRLSKMGFPPSLVADVLKKTGGIHELALLELLKRLKDVTLGSNYGKDAETFDPGACAEEREQELQVLQSIYAGDNEFITQPIMGDDSGVGGQKLSVHLGEIDGIRGLSTLHVLLHPGSRYPKETPLVFVENSALRPGQLLSISAATIQKAASLIGEVVVYELCAFLQSEMQELAKHPAPQLVQIEKKSGQQIAAAAPAPPAGSVVSRPGDGRGNFRGGDRSRVQGRGCGRGRDGGSHRPPKPLPASVIEDMNSSLLEDKRNKAEQPAQAHMLRLRESLPAWQHREHILNLVERHQVCLVSGETGCGKTTQVPQFILDSFIEGRRGGECSIICTQPRRIAAMGVAGRVADERTEEIGDTVGYQVRMDKKASERTRLLFCTTGVLLRKMLNDRRLQGVTHLIVDEVHERSIDTDFLLSIVRDILPQRPKLRVILMSATMEDNLFAKYFGAKCEGGVCPMVQIPGRTFPVTEYFLEDVIEMTGFMPRRWRRPKADEARWSGKDTSTYSEQTSDIMTTIDEKSTDYEMLSSLVAYLHAVRGGNGAVLIFLPGVPEISKAMRELGRSDSSVHLWILPLHGGLLPEEQRKVFRRPPSGKRKVILATNIAETSITIDDIEIVIDSGKVKEMRFDPYKQMACLVETWVSRAAATQRRGRAGRVKAGNCYRLFSRRTFDAMDAQQTAEIHRVPLTGLCLTVKMLELGPGKGGVARFLGRAIDPPKAASINKSLELLEQIGGIDANEDLRPLGYHLAALPVDVRIGKLLIFGALLRCIDPMLSIAAVLSTRSPFLNLQNRDPDEKHSIELQRKEISRKCGKSDHMVFAKTFALFVAAKDKRKFCMQLGLSFDGMNNVRQLRKEYARDLTSIGFLPGGSSNPALNVNADSIRMVSAALCAGMYSNVLHVIRPTQKYHETAEGSVAALGKAQELQFYMWPDQEPAPEHAHRANAYDPLWWRGERAFVHPSSCNFEVGDFESPWLVYHEKVRTTRLYIRESTMVTPYALMLFGGRLEVQHQRGIISVDKWVRFQAVARIGVLVKALRTELDSLLAEKVERPDLDISCTRLMEAIESLLQGDGM